MHLRPDPGRPVEATGFAPAFVEPPASDSPSLQAFRSLRFRAAEAVLDQLAARSGTHPGTGDASWRVSCREELWALLDFLDPTIEFGLLQPISDYLEWARMRTSPRSMPAAQLADALDSLAEFFVQSMGRPHGPEIADLLGAVRAVFVASARRQIDVHGSAENCPPQAAEFCAALIDGREADAMAMMQLVVCTDGGLIEFGVAVVQPAMREVGRRWLEEGLTAAVEHQATCIARTVMAAGLVRSAKGRSNGRSVLLSCVEGNTHDLGLHLVADAYRVEGWEVRCLGADVPSSDLVECAIRLKPDVLGLSIAFSHQLRQVRIVARGLRASAGDRMPVVVAGGGAAVRHERLVRSLGADGVALNASDAVGLANRLLQ